MGTLQELPLQVLYNHVRLSSLGNLLDELHTAASEGALETVTPLSNAELVSWLREIIYTAQETIAEIEEHATGAPELIRVK